MRRRGSTSSGILAVYLLALLLPFPADAARAETGACGWSAAACEAAPLRADVSAAIPASHLLPGAEAGRQADRVSGQHLTLGGTDAAFVRHCQAEAASAAASSREHAASHGRLRSAGCGHDGSPPRAPPQLRIR